MPNINGVPANAAKDKIIPHEIPSKPQKTLQTDKFTPNDSHFLDIVDYDTKFLTVKKAEHLSAE